jgi:adenylosuccinate synthase
MITTRFFQGLILTTFSMGVFNTIRGNKTSILLEKIIKPEAKYEELNKEYTSLLKKNLNRLENEREIQTKYLENSNETSINENIQEVINTGEKLQDMFESVNNKFDILLNYSNNNSQFMPDTLQSFFIRLGATLLHF